MFEFGSKSVPAAQVLPAADADVWQLCLSQSQH
jgi:hypothetical protein